MISRSVMIDLNGVELDAEEKERLQHPAVGGIILFSRNYSSKLQVVELVSSIRAATPHPDLLIAVDQEGGRVQRFRDDLTRLPAATMYSAFGTETNSKASDLTESAGWLMAAELLSLGIDFSFAPVLDVDAGVSEVIGDRSFSNDPNTVADLASSFRRGMKRAGMAAVGKHFPGHGAVALDSHLALPEDNRPFEAIEQRDLIPFKKLINEGLEGIMPAHIVYPQIDDKPAGFSPFWIQDVLRNRLSFKGAVFSDDLSMEGAAGCGGFGDRAHAALEAGCDMVLVCNQRDGAAEVLDSMTGQGDPYRQQRLSMMQGHATFKSEDFFASAERHETINLLNVIEA